MKHNRFGMWKGPLTWARTFGCAFVSALGVAWVGGGAEAAASADWPEWRGPGGQGHAVATNLPTHWSESSNVVWRVALPGRGWSTPVMAGDHIWMTTAMETAASAESAAKRLKSNTADQPLTLLDRVEFRVVCVSRSSGRLLHDVALFTEDEPQWVHSLNSYASPTPVIEDGRLYCHFGTFGTVCLETQTAAIVWSRRDHRIMHENGPGSSPIVWGDLLLVHMDGSDRQYVLALDKRTGKDRWRAERTGEMNSNPQLKKSYATPEVVKVGDREQLLSQGADWLYAYDPRDGREVWKLKYGVLGFSLSAKAVLGPGMMYLSTGFMRPEMFGVELGDGTGTGARVRWRYAKGAPTMSSPLLVGEELYFVGDSGGVWTCLDAATGKEHYRERLGGNHSASPIFADGKIYLPSREGEVAVIAPGKTFQLLARNRLEGKIMSSPIAVGNALWIRTDAALYRVEDRKDARR